MAKLHAAEIDFLHFKPQQDAVGDFAPDVATWRTGRHIRVAFDSGLFLPLYENNAIHRKRKYITYCIAVRGGPSHGTDNAHGKFRRVVFATRERTATQTNRHTDTQITIIRKVETLLVTKLLESMTYLLDVADIIRCRIPARKCRIPQWK